MMIDKYQVVIKVHPKNFFIKSAINLSIYVMFICLILFINLIGNKLNPLVTRLTFLILLVPIFQIFTQNRDDIYQVILLDNGKMLVKWKRLWVNKHIIISTNNIISVSVQPYLKNCYSLVISYKENGKISIIKQLCSKYWKKEKMDTVLQLIKDILKQSEKH
jgi:hypothetical protein